MKKRKTLYDVSANATTQRFFKIIVLQLSEVKRSKISHPSEGPYCGGETFQRWGTERREIKDPKIKTVQVSRYKCTACLRTFRHYPQGISHSQQSERMKQLAVICWTFGLGYRKLEAILSTSGCASAE